MKRSVQTIGAFLLILPFVFSAEQPVDAQTAKHLESQWRRIERRDPATSSRAFFDFALEASATGWHPERVEVALLLAEKMQDREETSRTYGNFAWYWRDGSRPDDRNAVEFCMQKGVLVWMRYRDRLTPVAREALERLMDFSVEGIRRHRVRVSYTNIYLMKLWNCIALGESTDRPELAREGYAMLDQWLAYTWQCGIHEYISPTYYGTDLDSLGLLVRHAKRSEERTRAEAALRLFWADIAANWFGPCARLGGAHSRDYDYLTGHGYLDHYLRHTGWLEADRRAGMDAFLDLCAYRPDASYTDAISSPVPRIVVQRWGADPWQTATHYVGKMFSIGSAGATYGPMDKPLTVNLAGGAKMPVMSFFMDVRGDPYGKSRFTTGGGHRKALHVEPFLASVQRGSDVLLLASAQSGTRAYRRMGDEASCLLSQLVMPSAATVCVGSGDPLPSSPERRAIPVDVPIFLRYRDVAIALRFLVARTTKGSPAPVELVRDGEKWNAMRLTCTHSTARPEGTGTIVLWVQAKEGLDETAFARFRTAFRGADCDTVVDGSLVEVSVPGADGRLRLVADVADERRIAAEGAEPNLREAILAVNGRDVGRELLEPLEPVRRRQRWVTLGEDPGAKTWPINGAIEAEAAAVILEPFTRGSDPTASGGEFVWVPGEEGVDGGSLMARVAWVLNIPTDGNYELWARVKAPTPKDDSFYVRVRQGPGAPLERTEWHTGCHADWDWVCATPKAQVALRKGRAVVEFHCREDGTRLDALFLGGGGKRPAEGRKRGN